MRDKRSPVVMVHGAFCGGWAFEQWRGMFEARGFKVHLPTLRYHDAGRHPPKELGTTSLTDYADDLETLLNKIGEPAFLVGHSMGGLLAQMLAARRDVRGVAALAPSAPYGILPSTAFEIASSQALYMAGEFWNKPLKPERWVATVNALDMLDKATSEKIFARFVPESGLVTVRTRRLSASDSFTARPRSEEMVETRSTAAVKSARSTISALSLPVGMTRA